MKVLFTGDVTGRPGRKAVEYFIPRLKKSKNLDLVIVNGENAAGGSGLTPKIVEELLSCGVDAITSGDHIWKKKEIIQYIASQQRLIRPANYPKGVPGDGYTILTVKDNVKIAVLNLLGRVFMKPLECPFRIARKLIEQIKQETSIIIVDFHAEATSEKIAMGWFLDGEVTAVLGTHTHVQTADERILPNKTAYITDVGMTGSIDSVLGRKVEKVLEHFLTGMPARFEMANENVQLQGVVLNIDEKTGKTSHIERLNLKLEDEQ